MVLVAAAVVAVFAVVFHLAVFVLESVLWTRPAVYARFGIQSQAEADTIRVMAYNQGFYNLALAIGVAAGVVLLTTSGDTLIVGRTLVVLATACMAVAGAVLATSGRFYRRSATLQFVPAVLALIFTLVG